MLPLIIQQSQVAQKITGAQNVRHQLFAVFTLTQDELQRIEEKDFQIDCTCYI